MAKEEADKRAVIKCSLHETMACNDGTNDLQSTTIEYQVYCFSIDKVSSGCHYESVYNRTYELSWKLLP